MPRRTMQPPQMAIGTSDVGGELAPPRTWLSGMMPRDEA